MKVFIMWSGDQSRSVGNALKEFLEAVVAAPTYFMSDQIGSGEVWRNVLTGELAETSIGIAVMTSENVRSHWIHWEAGVITKSAEDSRVIPYLVSMDDTDLVQPLSDLQFEHADRAGTMKLAQQINQLQSARLRTTPQALEKVFEKVWPDVAQAIEQSADKGNKSPEPQRPAADLSAETLRRLRRVESLLERAASMSAVEIQEPTPPGAVKAIRRIESFVKVNAHDDLNEIKWDDREQRIDVQLNGSTDWPPERSCDRSVLEELASPWPVHFWSWD